jgi:hypothetical protein
VQSYISTLQEFHALQAELQALNAHLSTASTTDRLSLQVVQQLLEKGTANNSFIVQEHLAILNRCKWDS